MASNTAIFYDIENLLGVFAGKTKVNLNLNEIYKRVLDTPGVTGVGLQRAYADWGVPMCRSIRNTVLEVGIEPIQIFNTNQNDRIKNAADICLIIDAVELIVTRPEIENFVIASGDGIFAFLSKKLHEHGKNVIGCSFGKIANSIFRNSCNSFMSLEKTEEYLSVTTTKRGEESTEVQLPSPLVAQNQAVAPSQPMTQTQAVAQASTQVLTPVVANPPQAQQAQGVKLKQKTRKKQPPLPKIRHTDALLSANIQPPEDMGDKAAIMDTVRQIVNAIFTEETRDLPGLEVSIFANYIAHFMPDFKVKTFGAKGMGGFMRLMLTGSEYCTYSVSDHVMLIATRAQAEKENGKIVPDTEGLLVTTADGEIFNSIFNTPVGSSFLYNTQKYRQNRKQGNKTEAPVEETPIEEAPAVEEKPAPVESVESVESAETAPAEDAKGTIRKLVKVQFETMAKADSLPEAEVENLTTSRYALDTFGVRSEILRPVDPAIDIAEQRLIKGKIRYWREVFTFNGKDYLIFKEWANLHRERFVAWSQQFEAKS